MFKEQLKRFNTTSLKPNSQPRINHMLPSTLTATSNNSSYSVTNHSRFLERSSNIKCERCYYLLIQLIFYGIIIMIIYLQFGQINNKQTRILSILNSNHNVILNQDLQNRPSNHNQSV